MADIFGTDQNDSLQATDESNLIIARAGNDTITGGSLTDDIFGGDGDDTIDGGAGNDLINGGSGADTINGGLGQDIIYGVTPGDVIDGGEGGGDDFDQLNLTGSAPDGGSLTVVYDPANRENGEVLYRDAAGNDAGKVVFTNIEKVVPCFTPGTRIATPRGQVAVETLKVGDLVMTRDNGMQPIRWIGMRALSATDFYEAEHLYPIRIAKGALGNDLPERDMLVSPNHRMLVASDKTVLYFEESEVLVAAKHLTGLVGVGTATCEEAKYIHLMFDQHEVILSDGTWSESFQPGVQALAGVGNAQRLELLEIFPELANYAGIADYPSARRSVKAHEAALLIR